MLVVLWLVLLVLPGSVRGANAVSLHGVAAGAVAGAASAGSVRGVVVAGDVRRWC